MRLFALLFVVLAVFAPRAYSQSTLHVPGNFSTIQDAIDAAQSGDTVEVAAGTYRENLDFKGKSITVTSKATSYSDATTAILQGDGQNPVVSFHNGEPSGATLNGFTVQGGCVPNETTQAQFMCGGIRIDGASPTVANNVVSRNENAGVFIINGSSPLLQGNDIKGNNGHGLLIVSAGDIVVRNNVIEENSVPSSTGGQSIGAGISASALNTFTSYPATSLVLDHNIIRNNVADGQPAYEQQSLSVIPQLKFLNNAFYGNRSRNPGSLQIYIWGASTASLPSHTALTEINNTIVGGSQLLIGIFAASTIANNAFYNTVPLLGPLDPEYAGLSCDSSPKGQIDIHNNDIYNAGTQIDGKCPLGANNLAVDPQLRDIPNGDVHEQEGSPLAGAGDIDAPQIPNADLDNKARTVCGKIDIGAYQLRPHPPIALTSSANPTPGGGTIIFSAKLTGNCNVPTGTVTFLDGSTVIGTGALDSAGNTSFATSFLVVGNHNITATYPGDFNFDESTSPVLVQVITGDPTATSLTVAPNPASAFAPITLSSSVTSQYGTPTGSVVFQTGSQVLATATLDGNGRASTTIRSLGAGTYNITAQYTADTRFQPSTSAVVREVVIGADSATTITATPNPAAAGQPVLLTANVRATQSNQAPTGTVTFLDGTVSLGSGTLNNGIATLSTSGLALGSHVITARYAGSSDFNPSSASMTETVNLIGTSLALGSSPNPSNTGQSVTLTATLASSLAGSVPVGTVTFREGVTVLGTATLNASGVATFSTSTLSVGTHSLQATFAGDGIHASAVSPIVSQSVLAYDFTVSVSNSTPSIPSGDWMRLTVTVAPVGVFTGNVILNCSNLPDHADCGFENGSNVSLSKGQQQVSLVLNTSDVYRYGDSVSSLRHGRGTALAIAFGTPLFGFLVAGRKKRAVRLLLALCVPALLYGLQGCSGKLPGSTAPGTYTVSLVGTSNDATPINHSAKITLRVTSK